MNIQTLSSQFSLVKGDFSHPGPTSKVIYDGPLQCFWPSKPRPGVVKWTSVWLTHRLSLAAVSQADVKYATPAEKKIAFMEKHATSKLCASKSVDLGN
jgi:hypothetical protein